MILCYNVQTISKQQLYSFILQSLYDNVQTIKYLFLFISNQLIWASDSS